MKEKNNIIKDLCEEFLESQTPVKIETKIFNEFGKLKIIYGIVQRVDDIGVLIYNKNLDSSAYIEFALISLIFERKNEVEKNGNDSKKS